MIYLLLGANLGNRVKTLQRAAQLIGQHVGPILSQSALYETAPWGVSDQPTYLNQVLAIETTLPAEDVLVQAQVIEQELGRVRFEKWGARVIDIDILYYGDLIQQSDTLTIPHPFLHQRRFTLVPLAEIAPGFIHPVIGKTNRQLLAECDDEGEVKPFF
ncbi:2-amino-4-hydroxy-6-hydroxymethyldihydropteridine diphosphokinase [Spirosoma lituiforme]